MRKQSCRIARKAIHRSAAAAIMRGDCDRASAEEVHELASRVPRRPSSGQMTQSTPLRSRRQLTVMPISNTMSGNREKAPLLDVAIIVGVLRHPLAMTSTPSDLELIRCSPINGCGQLKPRSRMARIRESDPRCMACYQRARRINQPAAQQPYWPDASTPFASSAGVVSRAARRARLSRSACCADSRVMLRGSTPSRSKPSTAMGK